MKKRLRDIGEARIALEATTRMVLPVGGSGTGLPSSARRGLGMKLLNAATATFLDGTEDGRHPFFSPDGRWIGFFAGSKLRKIAAAGGPPIDICDSSNGRGASWTADGNIVAALSPREGQAIVSATGGQPRPLASTAPGDATHRWPQHLPGDKAAIFTAGSATAFDNNDIKMVRLDTGAVTTILHGGYFGRYLPTSDSNGVLLYVRGGVLFGVPFDPDRGVTHGTAVTLLDDVAANPNQGRGQFDFSSDGTFVYASGRFSGAWTVASLDSTGVLTSLSSGGGVSARWSKAAPELFFVGNDGRLAMAPDGKHFAVIRAAEDVTGQVPLAVLMNFTDEVRRRMAEPGK